MALGRSLKDFSLALAAPEQLQARRQATQDRQSQILEFLVETRRTLPDNDPRAQEIDSRIAEIAPSLGVEQPQAMADAEGGSVPTETRSLVGEDPEVASARAERERMGNLRRASVRAIARMEGLSPAQRRSFAETAMASEDPESVLSNARDAVPGGPEVEATFGAVDPESGERFTALRTNRGLFKQSVGEDGGIQLTPIDSSRARPVDTEETGTSEELGLGTKGSNTLEDTVIQSDAQIQRFNQIRDRFEDRFLTLPFRAEQSIKANLEKLGAEVGDDELEAYTKFQRDSIDSMNRYIKFITGAQMSEAEATRIRKGIPDPEKDSPTQFRSKLDATIQSLEAARRRAAETLQRNDISQPWELGGLDQFATSQQQGEFTADNPATPQTQEEWQNLPKGAVFIDPDSGELLRK